MIGFYGYTVWLTYLSLAFSTAGIFLAIDGKPLPAVACLILCGICDMFDGKVARTKKNRTEQEMKFGIQIDSLSDIVAFAVLPSAIGYCLAKQYVFVSYPYLRWIFFVIFAFYNIAALARLGYFNVTEEERQNASDEVRYMYLGLPVTNTAAIFPLIYCFNKLIRGPTLVYIYMLFILVCGFLFILKFKVKKPGNLYLLICTIVGIIVLGILFFL